MDWVAVEGRGLGGTMISLVGTEPELVREVERYPLDIVELTSSHSLGSGNKLLETF